MPMEPPPSVWEFPSVEAASPDGIVAIGGDLEPGTLLHAYRSGIFPMPVHDGPRRLLAWWSPDPRAVVPLHGFHVSRSLRRSRRHFDVRVDSAFDEVVAGCADPARPGGWITPEIASAYGELHRLGWAHSVEAWMSGRELAGGVYGVGIGGFFAGESMFHRVTDASKVALAALVEGLRDEGATLFDVQWLTPHLRSLGAVEMPRERYLALLAEAVEYPLPAMFRA
jgi:leucyl/phenylalanyl-tRNA--protein transferase